MPSYVRPMYGEIRRKENIYFVWDSSEEEVKKAQEYLIDFLGKDRVGDIIEGTYPQIDVLATRSEMDTISVRLGLDKCWI